MKKFKSIAISIGLLLVGFGIFSFYTDNSSLRTKFTESLSTEAQVIERPPYCGIWGIWGVKRLAL
jgi:hypothetical protein